MRRLCALFLVMTLCAGTELTAQQRSPVQDVLGRARSALLDLRYDLADSLTREVLQLEIRLRRSDRILALQIAAAAQYPEEMEAQHKDSASTYLRRLVRLAPNAQIPSDISWEGLDQLLAEIQTNTFGFAASPARDNRVSASEPGSITVAASMPARFRMFLHPINGAQDIPLTEAGPSLRATLPLKLVDSTGPRVPSGDYELVLVGFNEMSLDSVLLRYRARLDAPPLQMEAIPTAVDSTRLLPERTKPARTRSVIAGIIIGTGTALAATAARDPAVEGTHESDSRAAGTGVLIGLASIAAGFLLDRGDPIPANIEQNRALRENIKKQIQDLSAENSRRRTSYAATLTIDVEALP